MSASDCWAVGSSNVARINQTLIERWDGTSWTIVSSPNSPMLSNYLKGVTCVSTSNCWAVGVSGSINQTLIERWDGTSWAIVSSPNTSTTQNNTLVAVTCVSASNCWAAGYYSTGNAVQNGVYQTLIERWDGTAWAIVSSPNTSTTQRNQLFGVTCVSAAADCWAVGSYVNGSISQTLIERWDGTSWAIVSSPNILITQSNSLLGITCVSASDCWAAGSYSNGSVQQTLIERWDGTSWAIVSSPNTSIAQSNGLTGVTCVSASNCWAVGSYYNASGVSRTLIERWNGTAWAIVSSPNTPALRRTTFSWA